MRVVPGDFSDERSPRLLAPRAQRILLIKPSSLGDIVHALPVLAALRAAYPHAHIAWLVANAFAPLLDKHPLLDEVIRFDRRHYGRMLRDSAAAAAFARFVRDLRTRRFDLVVDLQGLVRSGFLAWASGATWRIGFGNAREFGWLFYTHAVRPGARERHAIDRNRAVAQRLGLPRPRMEFPLGLRAEELAAVRELLARAGAGTPEHDPGGALPRAGRAPAARKQPFLAVVPGARWESKRWRPDRLAEVITRAHEELGAPAVLLGAPDDRTYTDEIRAALRVPVVDLVGCTTLRELVAVLALAEVVLCHDSGPMHVSAALGRRVVAVFGPTDVTLTGPYTESGRVVQRVLPCVPCRRRRCPLGHHACMQELGVEGVYRAVRESWLAQVVPPLPVLGSVASATQI